MNEETSGYGLCRSDPVLCGGGPMGEHEYLQRLRCPSGSGVTYKRLGNVPVTDLRYLLKRRLAVSPELSEIAQFSHEPVTVPLDRYSVVCGCGSHSLTVFMDMYHQGTDHVIAQPGWSLNNPSGTP